MTYGQTPRLLHKRVPSQPQPCEAFAAPYGQATQTNFKEEVPYPFSRERCEELCESRAMALPENPSVPAGVRSTLDLVQSHSQGPIWVAKTVAEIRNKTP